MSFSRIPMVLSIAGSDPSGGAGIQADLKTLAAFGVYTATVITAITVQNSCGVHRVVALDAGLVVEQARAILSDYPVAAIKLGMLATAEIVEALSLLLGEYPQIPVIVDPVLCSSSGAALLDQQALAVFREALLPRTSLLTPNVSELLMLAKPENLVVDRVQQSHGPEAELCKDWQQAGVLTSVFLEEQASRLLQRGCNAVLVTGGETDAECCVDYLFQEGGAQQFTAVRVKTPHTHGTGCTLASAITACLVLGDALPEAISKAKQFLGGALLAAEQLPKGAGRNGLHHFFGAAALQQNVSVKD
ncbi:MAG: hydroxymethylpyrimidine/phosphomethylpyrimidine kinase [Pseudomonadales bacterium]|nr:hydroxymethylpyrimidine/phosphomethylpyrimidine kinase [Pseudomonadales bacterium]